MDSVNITMNATLLEEEKEATLSKFRRRNTTLILILFSMIIILIALITASFIYLFPQSSESTDSSSLVYLHNPAIESFCSVTSNAQSCFKSLEPNIRFLKYPDQVFTLYLKLTVRQIENITLFLSTQDVNDQTFIKNCSVLLNDALSQLGRGSTRMWVIRDQDLQTQVQERRTNIVNWFIAADEDLASCLDDLVNVDKSTDLVDEMRDKVTGANMYVGSCVDYMMNYGIVLARFEDATGAVYHNDLDDVVGTVQKNLFVMPSVCTIGT